MIGRKLDVGETLNELFGLFRDEFARLVAIVLLALSPVLAIQAVSLFLDPMQKVWISFAIVLPSLVFQQFATAALLQLVFARLRGRETTVGRSFGLAWRRLFPVVLTALVVGLILLAGFVLLLVPGIIAAVWLYAAIPVAVIEGRGPIASLHRSSDLTEGHRWQIFFIGVVMVLIGSVVGGIGAALAIGVNEVIGGFVQLIFGVLSTALGGVAQCVVYHRLLRHEGNADDYAAVFA